MSVFPLVDGVLQEASQTFVYEGKSVHERQEMAHAHQIVVWQNTFVFVVDLGSDCVHQYIMDDKGWLSSNGKMMLASGQGPRHMVPHPSLNVFFIANELSSTVSVHKFDAQTGQLSTAKQVVSSLPSEYKQQQQNSPADIHLDPQGGNYLYMSNRGHDSIAVFRVNQQDGTLTSVGFESTGGDHPRNFLIEPTGRFLLVANRDSDNVVVFRRNQHTGLLSYSGFSLTLRKPVCLKFVKFM